MSEYDKQKGRIAALIAQRDRTGKKRLTKEERLEILYDIYEGCLFWLKQCVVTASSKGSSSAALILSNARSEIEYLETRPGRKNEMIIRFATKEEIAAEKAKADVDSDT